VSLLVIPLDFLLGKSKGQGSVSRQVKDLALPLGFVLVTEKERPLALMQGKSWVQLLELLEVTVSVEMSECWQGSVMER
jgi:hypothetical protein